MTPAPGLRRRPEPSRSFPAHPGDVPRDVTLAVLLDSYQRHLLHVTAARVTGSSPPDAVDRALAALALATVVIEDLRRERQVIATDLLAEDIVPGSAVVRALGLPGTTLPAS